jgi:hypothetical protein
LSGARLPKDGVLPVVEAAPPPDAIKIQMKEQTMPNLVQVEVNGTEGEHKNLEVAHNALRNLTIYHI